LEKNIGSFEVFLYYQTHLTLPFSSRVARWREKMRRKVREGKIEAKIQGIKFDLVPKV